MAVAAVEPSTVAGVAQCGIEDEPLQLLPCTHRFHDYCLMQLATTRNKHWADVPCSVCRSVPNDVADNMTEADRQAATEADAPVENRTAPAVDRDGGEEVDTREEVDEEFVDAFVLRCPAYAAKDKQKSKAKVKAKPGTKAKANAKTKAVAAIANSDAPRILQFLCTGSSNKKKQSGAFKPCLGRIVVERHH